MGEYVERWMAVDSGKMDRPLTASVGGRMNGQGKKDRRMGRWRDRCVCLGEWKDTWTGKVKGWLNRLMNGEWVSGYLHGQMDISMDEWSHGTDG